MAEGHAKALAMTGHPKNPQFSTALHRGRLVSFRAFAHLVLSITFVVAAEALVAVQSTGGIPSLAQITPYAWCLAIVSMMAFLGLMWAVFNRLLPALLIVAMLLIFLVQAHVGKLAILGRPLVPWDILEVRQVLALSHATLAGQLPVVIPLLGVAITLIAGAMQLLRSKPRWSMGWAPRVLVIVLGGAFLLGLASWRSPHVRARLREIDVINRIWDNDENVSRNGLLLSLLLNIHSLSVYQPSYSESAVIEALGPFGQNPNRHLELSNCAKENQFRPDVVLYLGEAVWDPLALGVKFNMDPIPTLRRLWEVSGKSTVLSPVYGGGTANAEFEVLTGIPTAMLPEDSFAYQHYFSRSLESVPSIFRDHGYRTVAIHPFHPWFWGRNVVYPLLGIETFIASDKIGPLTRDGDYPSDELLVNRLIQELELPDSKPTFALAISIVTHGPYNYAQRPNTEVRVLDSLTPRTVQELENYATSLLHADRALKRLIEKLETRARPTVLILFGDHLPALGSGKSIYKETKYLSEGVSDLEVQVRMSRVPIAIWSNFPVRPIPDGLGMNFIGPYILRTANIEPSGYFAFIDDLRQRIQVIQHHLIQANSKLYEGPNDPRIPLDVRKEVDRLFLLGYDRLLGSGYSQPVKRSDK